MTYVTVQGVLNPDGKLILTGANLPDHPVAVMVTILEPDEAMALSQPGDYLGNLVDYEERLARGEIQWQ